MPSTVTQPSGDFLAKAMEDRGVAYAVVDVRCRVLEAGGAVPLLEVDGDAASLTGRSISRLVPELAGSESVVVDVCMGRLPRFELALVNREDFDRITRYLTIVVLPTRVPSKNAGAEEGCAIVVIQDVTELGQISQQLAQRRNELNLAWPALEAANVELRRVSELKSHFVLVAAHELRSPLTTIVGYLEMLVDGEFGTLNDEQRIALDAVTYSADRLRSITNDLLDVARIEAGRIDVQLVPTDLGDVVRQAVTQFKLRLRAKGQDLRVDLAEDLPLALCDAVRTVQVLTNLLGNAAAYTPASGHLGVDVRLAEQPGFLQVTVSDDGVGIAEAEQEHVFSRFFRTTTAQRMSASGTGLGLTIARELVELQGGRISLESELGKGTRVTFTVPAI